MTINSITPLVLNSKVGTKCLFSTAMTPPVCYLS